MAMRHRVALVRHADTPPPVRLRELERVPDDPVDTLEGIDLFLHGNFVQFEARSEQDVTCVHVVWHPRIAKRSDRNWVTPTQKVVTVRRHRHAGREVMVGVPRQSFERHATGPFLLTR
jgi:hypothetical protein